MNWELFHDVTWGWIFIAVIVFIVLIFVPAPYGRYSSKKWGLMIPDRWGWVIMEFPALAVFGYFYFTGKSGWSDYTLVLCGCWMLHYIHRTFVFPFRIRTKRKKMPVAIPLMAIFFNLVNGYLNGYYLGNFPGEDKVCFIPDPVFITGALLFLAGLAINFQSDEILIHLRKNSGNGYSIPYGGLFRWITSPNYFGEIVEWSGFTLMAWNLPALSFLLWTAANLIPRALNYQKWYRSTFPDYPPARKALIPFIL